MNTQRFCYDKQNRSTRTETTETVPSGYAQLVTPSSTIAGASYQATVDYDTLEWLTFGPLASVVSSVVSTAASVAQAVAPVASAAR